MPAKILKARTEGNEFLVQIHLDTAKVLEDGTPDPAWVHDSSWATGDPEGAVREATLRAREALARLQPKAMPAKAAISKSEGQEIKL